MVGGEFRILAPDSSDLSPDTGSENAELIVGCKYTMINDKGSVIAEGQASNAPNTLSTAVELSDDTLTMFQNFFSLLEQDIANSLTSGEQEEKSERNILEDILGNR